MSIKTLLFAGIATFGLCASAQAQLNVISQGNSVGSQAATATATQTGATTSTGAVTGGGGLLFGGNASVRGASNFAGAGVFNHQSNKAAIVTIDKGYRPVYIPKHCGGKC